VARWWRDGVVAAAVSLALGCVGCGVLSTEKDQQRASELAEKLFPGKLEVISARPLFPQTLGSEVAFRMTDDADAVVRLRIDREADTCDRKGCDEALTKAVEDARDRASALRTLTAAFDECGYEVYAIGQGQDVTQPWVAAAPTNSTVTSVFADIGECVARWSRARAAQDVASPAAVTTTVNIASPEAVRSRPTGGSGRPTMMRMTDSKLLGALSEHPYYRVGYTLRDGGVDPGSGSASLVRPFSERERFGKEVSKNAAAWLKASRPEAVFSPYTGVWRLLPGRVDRLKGYTLFCDQPDERKRCLGRHAVAVTTDLEGNLIGEPTVIRDVRIGNGSLQLPPM
jgi:hypothetical protein